MTRAEHGDGKLPMSEHHPHCPDFKLEEFVKVSHDGVGFVCEQRHLMDMTEGDTGAYTITTVKMTRDQFENLPEFEGF